MKTKTDTDILHLCVRARLEEIAGDEIPPNIANEPEGTSMLQPSNNIAQRNMSTLPTENIVGNGGEHALLLVKPGLLTDPVPPQAVPMDLLIGIMSENGETLNDMLEGADVYLDLDDDFFEAWIDGGGQGSDFSLDGEGLIFVTGNNFSLTNITLDPNDIYPMHLGVVGNSNFQPFKIGLLQSFTDDGCSFGGEIYEIGDAAIIDTKGVSTRDNNNIKLSPNPTSDFIELNGDVSMIYHMTVLDQFGKTMPSLNKEELSNRLDIRSYPPGIYYIHVPYDDQNVEILRFVKIE